MNKPDLNRIKASLQNIEAKRIVLINEISSLKDYYTKEKYGNMIHLEAHEANTEFKNTTMKYTINAINEILELESIDEKS